MEHTVPVRFKFYAGMGIGRGNGGVVDMTYDDRKPFAFTGTIKRVVFDVEPHDLASEEEDVQARLQQAEVGDATGA